MVKCKHTPLTRDRAEVPSKHRIRNVIVDKDADNFYFKCTKCDDVYTVKKVRNE